MRSRKRETAHRNTMQCRKKKDNVEEQVEVIARSSYKMCGQGSLKLLEKRGCSGLAEVRQDRVDELKGLVDLLADFSTGKDDLARNEDEENNPRLHHAIDETREQLRLVGRESVMARGQALKTDRETNVARADNVLDLEVLWHC